MVYPCLEHLLLLCFFTAEAGDAIKIRMKARIELTTLSKLLFEIIWFRSLYIITSPLRANFLWFKGLFSHKIAASLAEF